MEPSATEGFSYFQVCGGSFIVGILYYAIIKLFFRPSTLSSGQLSGKDAWSRAITSLDASHHSFTSNNQHLLELETILCQDCPLDSSKLDWIDSISRLLGVLPYSSLGRLLPLLGDVLTVLAADSRQQEHPLAFFLKVATFSLSGLFQAERRLVCVQLSRWLRVLRSRHPTTAQFQTALLWFLYEQRLYARAADTLKELKISKAELGQMREENRSLVDFLITATLCAQELGTDVALLLWHLLAEIRTPLAPIFELLVEDTPRCRLYLDMEPPDQELLLATFDPTVFGEFVRFPEQVFEAMFASKEGL